MALVKEGEKESKREGGRERRRQRERYFDWLNSWTKILTNSGRFLTNTVRSQRRKTVRKLKLATKRIIIREVFHNKTCDKQFRCLRSAVTLSEWFKQEINQQIFLQSGASNTA